MGDLIQKLLWKAGRIFRYMKFCLKAAEPCVGIGGLRSWMEASEAEYSATCCHDFDGDIEKFYCSLSKHGNTGLEKVAAGEKKGDLLSIDFSGQETCELFIAGPPCQPYAANASKAGFADPRSEVLERCCDLIIEMAHRGSLVVFLLENSERLTLYKEFWKLIDKIICACPLKRLRCSTMT